MPPFKRPSAFDVSFPEDIRPTPEPPDLGALDLAGTRVEKRKNEVHSRRFDKRPRSLGQPTVRHYVPKTNEIPETPDLLVIGEDMYAIVGDSDEKPIRILSDFSFFDAARDMEMLSLSTMDNNDRHFEGAGLVSAYHLNEEDDGQLEDSEEENHRPQFVRLTAILRYGVNYAWNNDLVYVETQHAFYILGSPARSYKSYYLPCFKPHHIAQLVLKSALSFRERSLAEFLQTLLFPTVHSFGQTYRQDDLNDAIPVIKKLVEEHENSEYLMGTPFLQQLLRDAVPTVYTGRPNLPRLKGTQPNFHAAILKGSIDLAVLRPENQCRTHVTPHIESLASSLFSERFVVIGPPRPLPKKEEVKRREQQDQQATARLRLLIRKALNPHKKIMFKNDQRLKARSNWLQSVTIDDVVYRVGDTVITPIGENEKQKAPVLPEPDQIPPTSTIQDHFWFAKIIYIDGDYETAHVQWFWHSSTTAMQEIFNPQELFLSLLCDTIDLRCVVGKAIVNYKPGPDSPDVKHGEFFYKFVYDSALATYTDVDKHGIEAAGSGEPPNNCPICLAVEQRDSEACDRNLRTGVAYRGVNYHVYDFALIRANDGPCQVGHITDIRFPQGSLSPNVIVKLLGRVNNLSGLLPPNVIKDERHLFITEPEVRINIEDLIRICYVFPYNAIDDLDFWTSISADHFYIRYQFPSLDVTSWNDKQPIVERDILVCVECCRDKLRRHRSMKDFVSQGRPLRALDLFGGVGAFSLGMEETKCIKLTHAVEISPSAAQTFKRNSPNTIVYNQCVNIVLKYAVKRHNGHVMEAPLGIHDGKSLPPPPAPGMIDILLAGFPCQSHSELNMFRKAEDPKSSLILTTLSWIDFLRPQICVFENVRGFLKFSPGATQAGIHKVEGGIAMGGLKLLLRALVSMNYQVRFALLQAAHYGTPQTRVRFFLIASKSGFRLPEFPQPTHDFPLVDALTIKLPIGDIIRPIRTTNGTAPLPFVTIDDAISDLPRFDWKNPKLNRESAAKQREAQVRQRTIPALVCKQPYCGLQGVVEYHHEPKTTYQVRSRKRATNDLQHYTRCLLDSKIERVVNIPLHPKADYRSLRPDLYEWQFADPASAVARAGFKPGLYGRLDKDGWFSTTVTNVDPTAKQSRVLNPYCKRMVTVRELARSQGFPDYFVFESINNNIITMHRQIGNAVPWLVSIAIGREIREVLFENFLADQERGDDGAGVQQQQY